MTLMMYSGLGRISGLDPAEPLFQGMPPEVRLDPGDAKFVDVIHTDSKEFYKGGLGMEQPVGHVDFYPNGGKAQRGCQNLLIGGLYDFIYCKFSRCIFVILMVNGL